MKATASVGALLRLWLKLSAANRFHEATWQPAAAQKQKLLGIVRRNQNTTYGQEHGFGHIRSIKDYQAHVPRNSYETLSPYIERVMRGEPNVLTAEQPLMFATTSGTTGRSKYIPVTPSYLREYNHGVQVHTYQMLTDFPDILEGKALVSASGDIEGYTESGLPYGAISGHVAHTQPAFVRGFYAIPYEISKIKQFDSKYYLTLRYALAADIRILLTPNPSSLLLLAEKMTVYADELIYDIRHGTVNPAFVPENASTRLTSDVRPDPRRADDLSAHLRRNGRLLPADAWPNLRIITCWKGGTMPLYLRKVPTYFGDCPIRDLGYMATEGRGATPLVNSGAGGVLNITSHFFEFVPADQIDDPAPDFLTCDELESNREYYVHFTTSAGLYRYDINDVIRVVDFFHHTPVIQFVRKGQGITSITGEKLTEPQVTAALLQAMDMCALDIEHVTACVEWDEPPHYAFYAELSDLSTERECQGFLAQIDRALCAQNIEYEGKRSSGRLGVPVLKRVARGSYDALRQLRVAEGAPETQVKFPHLSPDMKFGERLRVLDEVRVDDKGVAR
jgi:hypothetical protein